MKIYKKIALASLLMLPMMAQASGIGIYVPMALSSDSSIDDDGSDITRDEKYKTSAGLGLSYDSNVGMDKMFGYRLGLEYMKVGIDTVKFSNDPTTYVDSNDYTRYNMVHTFEFGFMATEDMRLWIGPRVNIAYQAYEKGAYSESFVEFGVAPALGVNTNIGSSFASGIDIDYKVAGAAGSWSNSDNGGSGTTTGAATGLTVRIYLMFRFGESGSVASAPTTDDSTPSSDYPESDNIIDESL